MLCMLNAERRVVLYGNDSGFFEYAAFHLAAAGLRTVAVTGPQGLSAALAEGPCAVLLHWDTLEEGCLRACALLKGRGTVGSAPIVILSERLHGGVNIVAAFASGADALIEGAINPRILLSRLRSVLPEPAPASPL
jgi:DNA-binding response OmpR family regulator